MTTPSSGRRGTWTGTRSRQPPKAYVGGPAQIRVVENGPARVAVEVSREAAAPALCRPSGFRRATPESGVEFANAIDWNTRESNLKATFPLAASNQMATYNWDIGTIERPSARAEEVRSAVAPVDRPDGHERRVRRHHPDRLQERIG